MDLKLSDEQVMLQESAERFVRDWSNSGAGKADALWGQFAELGWLALPLPDDLGGFGGSVLDATLLLEQFGRGLPATAYISTVVVGAGLVQALGNSGQRESILPAVAVGDLRLALAHTERGPRGGPSSLDTKAMFQAGRWKLSGAKIAVMDARDADVFLVSAKCADSVALFAVPRKTAGVRVASYAATGGGDAATIEFTDVDLAPDARLGDGDATIAIGAATDDGIAALCAEAVGIMAALLDATVNYTNTREQFDRPLTANQSVRFKLADMAVALEEARSLSLRAALMLAAPPNERVRAVAGAKAGIGRGARRVAELAIQLHGAMGVTEELTIGAYYKRLLAFDALYGGIDHQLARHAVASGRMQPALEIA